MNPITGGCQCGKVRYAMHVDRVEKPHVCHCRMCQKATGGVFAALAGCAEVKPGMDVGAPAMFASSSLADAGVLPGLRDAAYLRLQRSPRRAFT